MNCIGVIWQHGRGFAICDFGLCYTLCSMYWLRQEFFSLAMCAFCCSSLQATALQCMQLNPQSLGLVCHLDNDLFALVLASECEDAVEYFFGTPKVIGVRNHKIPKCLTLFVATSSPCLAGSDAWHLHMSHCTVLRTGHTSHIWEQQGLPKLMMLVTSVRLAMASISTPLITRSKEYLASDCHRHKRLSSTRLGTVKPMVKGWIMVDDGVGAAS